MGRIKKINNLFSYRQADKASREDRAERQHRDTSSSSTSLEAAEANFAASRADAIAILEVPRRTLNARIDTSRKFYIWRDVGLAMRHVDTLDPGRYVVFRGTEGRIFLQDKEAIVHTAAKKAYRQKRYRF